MGLQDLVWDLLQLWWNFCVLKVSRMTCAYTSKFIASYAKVRQPVEIKPLKARHDVIKSNLIVLLLSLLCIDIDLSIQLISLTLNMTWEHYELYRGYKSWIPCKYISCTQLVNGVGQSNRSCSTLPLNWSDNLSWPLEWLSHSDWTNVVMHTGWDLQWITM